MNLPADLADASRTIKINLRYSATSAGNKPGINRLLLLRLRKNKLSKATRTVKNIFSIPERYDLILFVTMI